jgi:hypothetical protein
VPAHAQTATLAANLYGCKGKYITQPSFLFDGESLGNSLASAAPIVLLRKRNSGFNSAGALFSLEAFGILKSEVKILLLVF